MKTFGSVVRLLAGGATITIVLSISTACGGSSSGGNSVASSPAAAGSTGVVNRSGASQAATSGGSAPTESGRPIDVCATLPAAKAAQLSGQPITTADPRTGLMPREYGCNYGNDDDSLQVEVTVFEHDAKASYDTFSSAGNNTSVSGLGDKAFYDNDGTLYVLAGNNLVQVNGLDSSDECAALARPVLAAL